MALFKGSSPKHATGEDLSKIVKKFHHVTKDDLENSFVVRVNDTYLALFAYANAGRNRAKDFSQNADMNDKMAILNVFCTADGRILKNNLPVKGDELYTKEVALPTRDLVMEVM